MPNGPKSDLIAAGVMAIAASFACAGGDHVVGDSAAGTTVTVADSLAMVAGGDVRAAPPRSAAIALATEGKPVVERGIGVVFFDGDPFPEGGSGADTLLIQRDTTTAAVLARFIHRKTGHSWPYMVEAPDSVSGQSLEFGHEIDGLPVEHTTSDGRWARVMHGRTRDGTVQYGWVRVSPGKARFRRWSTVLPERPLFFDEGITPEFHGSVRGKVVEFPLRERDGGSDYIMHSVQVQGEWMQVRVATPSDVCGVQESVRQSLLWIRYLDERNRPRVWFHPRGC